MAFVHQHIRDILVPGFVEKRNDYRMFRPMNWWLFLHLESGDIIEYSANHGDIRTKTLKAIQCPFDLEEDDEFCLSSLSGGDYGRIEAIDDVCDVAGNRYQVNIRTDTLTIGLNAASSLDGFEVILSTSEHMTEQDVCES